MDEDLGHTLVELLSDVEKLLLAHHEVGSVVAQWGGICGVCAPTENSPKYGIFPRIKILKAAIEKELLK